MSTTLILFILGILKEFLFEFFKDYLSQPENEVSKTITGKVNLPLVDSDTVIDDLDRLFEN